MISSLNPESTVLRVNNKYPKNRKKKQVVKVIEEIPPKWSEGPPPVLPVRPGQKNVNPNRLGKTFKVVQHIQLSHLHQITQSHMHLRILNTERVIICIDMSIPCRLSSRA